MATIKLQPSGAVVLKDGKVACTCCAQPGCCPYPAQALFDGLYTVDDLPDQVIYSDGSRPDTILQKTLNPALVLGVGYIWPQDGSDDAGLFFIVVNDGADPIVWQFGDDGGEGGNECLITSDLTKDQFANSYTVAPNIGDSASPTIVTRISLCVWRGTDACGNFVYLSYGLNPDGGQDIMWNVFFRFYTPTCLIDGQVDGQKNDDEFENTPVGTYSGTFEDAAFVS